MINNFRKLLLLFVCVCLLAVPVSAVSAADADLEALAAQLTAEQFTDGEPAAAVTKNLNLTVANLPEGVTASFASSDPTVLTVSGATGTVIRDPYSTRAVTLTVTLSAEGAAVASKALPLQVLSKSVTVYAASSFYYPDYLGKLVTDVTPIADTYGIMATPSTLYGGGWSGAYVVEEGYDETNMNTRRFRTYLGNTDNEYCLYAYRPEAVSEYNYTRYIFRNKPTGKVISSMRLKFSETEPNQNYLFQWYANYLQSSGSLLRDMPVQIEFHRRATDGWVVINGQGYANIRPDNDSWFELTVSMDLTGQTVDVSIDGVKVNETPRDFRLKGQDGYSNCQAINDFQFNSFRTYANGVFYLDDMYVVSDNSYYEENQHKLRLADAMDFSDVAFYSDGTAADAIDVGENFTLDLTRDAELAAMIETHGLSVTWESSDSETLSLAGSEATVTRHWLAQQVTLTAHIADEGGDTVIDKVFTLTVPCLEAATYINAAYRGLRAEVLTHEAPLSVTQDLTLPTFAGVHIRWESSDETVLTSTGQVLRGARDKTVTLTAHISDETDTYSSEKTMEFCVLAENKYVYGAESFYHPADLNKELSEVTELQRWSNVYTASEPRLTNTVREEADGNYVLETARQAANEADYNFCRYSFPTRLENRGTVSLRFKLEHETVPQIYIFQLKGRRRVGGVVSGDQQIAEIQLYYTGTGGRVLAMSPTEEPGTIVLTNSPLETGRWYTMSLTLDNTAQQYDFYLDGVKMNPQPVSYYTAADDADFIAVDRLSYNSYRENGGGTMYVDDISVVGESGLTMECIFRDGGLYKTDDPGKVVSGSMDATVYLYNAQDTPLSVRAYLGIYQNGVLTDVRGSAAVSLSARASGVTVPFTDVSFPDEDGTEVRAYLFEAESLKPLAECKAIRSQLEGLHPETYADSGTGRSYQVLNLFGKNAMRGYFTMQGWSADSTKLYFWDAEDSFYEYDTVTNRGRFIDRGLYDYTLVTSPLNNVFYIDRNRDIIRMDCDTHEKEVVTHIPEAYCTEKVSMLQITNDESRLSVDWKDTGGDIDTSLLTRFPVYDLTSGEWIYRTYGFDSEQYNPNHLNINPAPDKNHLVLFAHEGSYVKDRVWVMNMNTGEAYNAFVQKPYTDVDIGETAGHETWTYDGNNILFCKGGKIGYSGLVYVGYDGKNRRYINSDYGYLHAGVSPVSDRWIISDTSYDGKTTKLVLVDSYTGDSHLLATLHQTGVDPGHTHPTFSQDGKKVYFGLYDNNDVISVGWMDVSDIIEAAPSVSVYNLSDSCQIETAERSHEVQQVTVDAETAYLIPNGGVMRVQVQVPETESCAADVTLRFLDEGTAPICMDYFIWEKIDDTYSLTEKTAEIEKTGTGQWREVTLSLSDMNLENMERLEADFLLRGSGEAVTVQSVSVAVVPAE